jgi:hypothetical protein
MRSYAEALCPRNQGSPKQFLDLAGKLKTNVTDLMQRHEFSPSKALVRGLAKELDIVESYPNRPGEDVQKDLGL